MKNLFFLLLFIALPSWGNNQNGSTSIKTKKQIVSERKMTETTPDSGFDALNKAFQEYNRQAAAASNTRDFRHSSGAGGSNLGQYFPNHSKYDSHITENMIFNSGKSVEELRASARDAEIKEISVNFLIAVGITIMIWILIVRSRYTKTKTK